MKNIVKKTFFCYTQKMKYKVTKIKRGTIKELGKYFLDISKILIGLTLITPLMKDMNLSFFAIFLVLMLFTIGTYLTNKGEKDE